MSIKGLKDRCNYRHCHTCKGKKVTTRFKRTSNKDRFLNSQKMATITPGGSFQFKKLFLISQSQPKENTNMLPIDFNSILIIQPKEIRQEERSQAPGTS